MTSLDHIRSALGQSYTAIENLCAAMSPAQWQAQSLCPDWTVRAVVSHLASIEQMLAGWRPGSAGELPPFDRVTAFAQQTAALDDAAFAARVAQTFGQRRADLAALSEGDLARPSWTPTGPGSYGSFMAIRVFDFWVHERDITTPLGLPADDGDARAEMALAEVERSLGYIVGKKIGLPDGSSTDSVTFVQLACGRIDPQAQIDAGLVRWTGDAELGSRAARNLRYTM